MATAFNLSDVFISYSRRDKRFVERLDQRFKKDGREVWVDWEDIPPSADWWDEIRAGIDGADTFVFVISPDSVASEICYDEVDYAHKQNKRMVPVLHREPDHAADKMHHAVSSHNWVFFRDDDDFEASYNKLIDTLYMDMAYTRLHTRYLVLAREWDNRKRDASYLLNGTEIDEAEKWLDESETKLPDPIPLQMNFIRASITRERKLLVEEKLQRELQLELEKHDRNRLRYLSVIILLLGVVAFLVFRLGQVGTLPNCALDNTQVVHVQTQQQHIDLILSDDLGDNALQKAASATSSVSSASSASDETQATSHFLQRVIHAPA